MFFGKEKVPGSNPGVGSNSIGPFPFIFSASRRVRDGVRNCSSAEVLYPNLLWSVIVTGTTSVGVGETRFSLGSQGSFSLSRVLL